MTALSDELKPCPFCGGAAALLPRTCDKNTPYNPADRAFPVARCGQCGAEAVGKDWGRPETAAEKWNTRALLAAQPAVQQPAEDAELLATVECLTDESGTEYLAVIRADRPTLYGKGHKWESSAQKVADIINSEFGRAAIKAQGGKQ